MSLHPISGPVPPEKLKELAEAPHGTAIKELRKHDPLYGLPAGTKVNWIVTVRREIEQEGTALVEAATEAEAKKLAEDLDDGEFDWWDDDPFGGEWKEMSVKPEPRKP